MFENYIVGGGYPLEGDVLSAILVGKSFLAARAAI